MLVSFFVYVANIEKDLIQNNFYTTYLYIMTFFSFFIKHITDIVYDELCIFENSCNFALR